MEQYPRFTFRLSPAILRKVDLLATQRNRSRGQVVREAVEFYFNTRFKAVEEPKSQ
jgi:predicted transcriptional regulator